MIALLNLGAATAVQEAARLGVLAAWAAGSLILGELLLDRHDA
jgi:hypothetical protein